MNNPQFDRLFDAAFEEAKTPGQDDRIVDHRDSWQRVQRRLAARRRGTGMRSMLNKLAMLAASLILGAFLFGNERAANAIEPITATIREYPSGLMSLLFGRSEDAPPSDAKTTPPPAYLEGLSFERINESILTATVTESQAKGLLSFRPPAFGYLPEGYSFDKAALYFYDDKEKADYAIYTFSSDHEDNLTVIMQRLKPGTSFGAKNAQDGITTRTVELSDGPAILMTANNQSSTLETISSGVHFSLSGKFDGETLVRIYEGMRS